MAERRQSIVQEVVGLPPDTALLLSAHDEELYAAGITSAEVADLGDKSDDSGASDQSEPEHVESDAEEDLDIAEQATAPVAAAAGTVGGKRKPFQPTAMHEIEQRREKGCRCRNKNCYSSLSASDLPDCRNMMEKMESDELQLFLAGTLDAMSRSGADAHHSAADQRAGSERRRRTYEYAVAGCRVCVDVFLYAHASTRYILHKVETHLSAGCVHVRQHGKQGTAPWNIIPEEELCDVVKFVENYAARFGLLQPAAPRGHSKPDPTYLPCHTTKTLLHSQYLQAGGKISYVSLLGFGKPDVPILL